MMNMIVESKMSKSEMINCEAQDPAPGKMQSPSDCLPWDVQKPMTKSRKKRSWKKPKGKPKRPLSAYNLFFQAERNNLIYSMPNVNHAHGYVFNESEIKSQGRKPHGKIGFAELAQKIAKKWKSLDESEKAVYEARAYIEKESYRKVLENWNLCHGLLPNREEMNHSTDFPNVSSSTFSIEFPTERIEIHGKDSFPNALSKPSPYNHILNKSCPKSSWCVSRIERIHGYSTDSNHSCLPQSSQQSLHHLYGPRHHDGGNANFGNQKILDSDTQKRCLQSITPMDFFGNRFENNLDDDSSSESAGLDAYMDDSFYDSYHHDDFPLL
jgi:HMG-box domain